MMGSMSIWLAVRGCTTRPLGPYGPWELRVKCKALNGCGCEPRSNGPRKLARRLRLTNSHANVVKILSDHIPFGSGPRMNTRETWLNEGIIAIVTSVGGG
jgi:hypothetical protein